MIETRRKTKKKASKKVIAKKAVSKKAVSHKKKAAPKILAVKKKVLKKSMTRQPKMKVELHDGSALQFHNTEQARIYDDALKSIRPQNVAGRAMSKRIAGYIKARTRKGQVARDRISGSKTK
jgi:hypothetical protein